MKIYVTADTHFNHDNILKYCARPFDNINEMNEAIIDNWNSVVNKDDIVYHLGDFILGSKEDLESIVKRLNGTIYLIRGNHDRLATKAYEDCGIVVIKKTLKLDEDKVILSHKPLLDELIPLGYINIHGHIHEKRLEDIYDNNLFSKDKHINVGVDVCSFKPVCLKTLKNN